MIEEFGIIWIVEILDNTFSLISMNERFDSNEKKLLLNDSLLSSNSFSLFSEIDRIIAPSGMALKIGRRIPPTRFT